MDDTLFGKKALVCGASAGIGAATARALADRGAAIVGVARRADRLAEVVGSLAGSGHEALVADLDDREALFAKVREVLRAGPIVICVNNTGGPPGGPLLEASADAFLETFSRHVLVAHGLAQLLVPGMKEQGYGRIVNVISTSVREPISGLGVSNTIRGAMASWAKTLANEVGPNVTVNNVLPGSTETERLEALADARGAKTGKTREQVYREYEAVIPEGRLAQPEEIAAAVAFLASPEASYIRGVSLQVDGGRMKSV
jgi:3-oxoacyl-[acyl-carrier protein] reductase